MGFPLEVVGAGKYEITCRIHIKYENNTDLKDRTDYLNGKSSKSYAVLKKMTLKMNFGCESYALLNKGINDNQGTTWSCKLLYEVTHFYKEKWDSLLQRKASCKINNF
jgi:hypothetical protein